ncbi:hypothetical protein B0H19DRAFT_164880 [Mycena capillaripes]|nr:hypothetical protein B0H19DRAFT_164880 [Mycena capillaripes]
MLLVYSTSVLVPPTQTSIVVEGDAVAGCHALPQSTLYRLAFEAIWTDCFIIGEYPGSHGPSAPGFPVRERINADKAGSLCWTASLRSLSPNPCPPWRPADAYFVSAPCFLVLIVNV